MIRPQLELRRLIVVVAIAAVLLAALRDHEAARGASLFFGTVRHLVGLGGR